MGDDETVSSASHARRAAVRAVALDAVLVIVFAVIGRASHDRGLSVPGVVETAWPFLVALALAWVTLFAWRSPARVFPTGVCVWLVTVAGGMLLRVASGQGTALAFIVVATVTLGVFLVGWRLIALAVRARSSRADTQSGDTAGS